MTTALRDPTTTITTDLSYLRLAIVNVFFYGERGAGDREWVLVDAGLPGTAERIAHAAEARFGKGSRPAAIVMTHAHFDHAGALRTLADRWDAPVYAHELELPYLTGRAAYPPPDPTVGGGAMARLSPLYPRGPFDAGAHVRTLPDDGSVPGMEGWRWVFTPGHSPGHVAFFRDRDRLLISGDAVITTKQESAMAVIAQTPEMHGPPTYFTQDWDAARESARTLADLEPNVIAAGHGRPLRGTSTAGMLRQLADNFDALARPRQGRYVNEPAVFGVDGPISVPPEVDDPMPKVLLGVGAALALGYLTARAARRDDDAPRRLGA